MRFYDREEELAILEGVFLQSQSAMVVISGRRRVGKSRLVDEFLREKDGKKLLVVPKEEKQVAADMAESLADEYAPTFNTIREGFDYFFTKSGSRILYIDEFSNFLDVNSAIPYEVQRSWEKHKEKTNKILIFSGSYARMMDTIFTRQKAPLFNRATQFMILPPLSFEVTCNIQHEMGIHDPQKQITNYCVFGGIPYYYELLERSPDHHVSPETFFFGLGSLAEEGQNILRQEFGKLYKKHFAILEAIGAGVVSAGEIANRMGIRQTTLSKYLFTLERDFKLIERIVPFGQNPNRSKKGVYRIRDNLLAFWFMHVYGKTTPTQHEELNQFVSYRFELLCIDYLIQLLQHQKEKILRSGKWWGNVKVNGKSFEPHEIDLLIETDKNIYIGECKWSNAKIGKKELAHLQRSAGLFQGRKKIIWVLFSKNGFTIPPEKNLLLFDAKKMASTKKNRKKASKA